MHELSLLNDLLRKIESIVQENGAVRADKVNVWLGAWSHISADHLRDHFVHAAKGTAAEGAILEIDVSADFQDPRAQDIILISVDVSNQRVAT
jgi:hydrogenase nickel incorporation protein HypA/HybF